jgi:hypothetical protein
VRAQTQILPTQDDAAPDSGSRRRRWLHDGGILLPLVILNALCFVWGYRFLPLQDYPDWLYQGTLLSQAIKGTLSEHYRVVPYPVPNAISTLLIGLLGLVFRPEVAGKLTLTLYVLTFIAGSAYLFTSTGGRLGPVFCIPLALLFSGFFFHGYLSYLLALCPLFFGIGYLLRQHEERASVSVGVVLAASLLLYLSHALAYAAWLVFLGLFFAARPSRRLAGRLLLALAPSLALLAVYVLQTAQGAGDTRIFYGERWLAGKLGTLFPSFHLFHGFYPVTSALDPGVALFGKLNQGFALLVGLACLWGAVAAWRDAHPRLPLAAGGAFLGIFLLSPRYLAANVLPDLRFLFPALWMLLAYGAPALDRRLGPNARRVGWMLGGGVLILQAFFLHGHAGVCAWRAEAVYGEMREAIGDRHFRAVFESHFNYEGRFRRVYHLPRHIAVHSPLSRLAYYLHIEQGSDAPIFATGIVKEIAPSPPLDSVSALRYLPEEPECLVTLGGDAGNRFIAGVLSHRYGIERAGRYAIVMERR